MDYGYPSEFGSKDICHLWRTEKWDPDLLIQLCNRVGAKYFAAMASRHDNFDAWDSKYQPRNSVQVGPNIDLIGCGQLYSPATQIRVSIEAVAGVVSGGGLARLL